MRLIDLAMNDVGDPWVRVTADILHYFPRNYQLNRNLSNFSTIAPIISELESVTSEEHSRLLPLECRIVSRNVISNITTAHQRPMEKHFQLKRNSKSAALRAELLQRSQEVSQQNRRVSTTSMHQSRRVSSSVKAKKFIESI